MRGKLRKMMLLTTALLFAMTWWVSAEAVSEAPEAAKEGMETGSGHEWETDIRLSITREDRLMQEAGMDLAAWDEAVDQVKSSGLEETVVIHDSQDGQEEQSELGDQ